MAKTGIAASPARKPISPKAAAVLEQKHQEEVKRELESIGAELWFYYQEIADLERKAKYQAVWAMFKLGQRCKAAHRKYAAGGLKKLAWALNKTEKEVEEACRLAEVFSETEMQDLLALRTPRSESLSKYHVLALASVEDAAKRKELTRRAAAEAMTVAVLTTEVQAFYGSKRSAGGRKFSMPASLNGLLSAWTDRSQKLLGFHDQVVAKTLDEVVKNTPPDKLSPAILEQIEQAHATAAKLREAADEDLERLASLKARVTQVIKAQPAADGMAGKGTGRPATGDGAVKRAPKAAAPPVKTLRPKQGPTAGKGLVRKEPGLRNKRVPPPKRVVTKGSR